MWYKSSKSFDSLNADMIKALSKQYQQSSYAFKQHSHIAQVHHVNLVLAWNSMLQYSNSGMYFGVNFWKD
jgi:hypothetical protein